MMNKICTKCPRSCYLTIAQDDDPIKVDGNKCNRGKEFGIGEVTNPERMVTSLIKVKDGQKPVLPVKLSRPVPKDKVNEVLKVIAELMVFAPVNSGEILAKIPNLDVDIIATAAVAKL